MRRFKLCSGSGFGIVDREETNCHILRKKALCQSSYELHDDGEGVFGSGLHRREVPALYLGELHHHL